MFENLTLTLAQTDGPPPPPTSPSTAPAVPAVPAVPGNGADQTTATTEQQPLGTGPDAAKPAPKPFADPLMIIALAVLAFMFFFTINSSRKEKKKRAALAASLKKNSKVRTIGGIIGTIAEIRDDVVVLKVDENTNTRMKFDRSAIATVLEDKGD